MGAVSVPAEVHLHQTTHLLAVGAGSLPVFAIPLSSSGIPAMLRGHIHPSLWLSPPMPPLPPVEAREKRSALPLSVSSLRDTRIPTHSSLSSRSAFIFPLWGKQPTRNTLASLSGVTAGLAAGCTASAPGQPQTHPGSPKLPRGTPSPADKGTSRGGRAGEAAPAPTAASPHAEHRQEAAASSGQTAAPAGEGGGTGRCEGAPGAEQGRVRCCRVLRKVPSPGRVLQLGVGLEGSSVTAALR